MLKNQKYPPNFPALPKKMTCSVDIIPALIRIKFDDHDLLLLKDVQDEPYESIHMTHGGPIQWIPKPWASGLDKYGLLGLINMPHFDHLNEAHACVKQLLACFHGGMLWLDCKHYWLAKGWGGPNVVHSWERYRQEACHTTEGSFWFTTGWSRLLHWQH